MSVKTVFVTMVDTESGEKSREPIGLHPEVANKWIESGKCEKYTPPSRKEQKSQRSA